MSILNKLCEKEKEYNDKMKSSAKKELIFSFHTTNTRELKTMFGYLEDIEEVIGIPRNLWSDDQEKKHKQKNIYLSNFNLIQEEKNSYYYTKTGQILKYLIKLIKDKNEYKELLAYLVLTSYKDIYDSLDNFYGMVKSIYSKEKIFKLTEKVVQHKEKYTENKKKLLNTEIFYVLMFYKDIELLEEFKKNSEIEIEELRSKECKGTFIEDKIRTNGSYNLSTILEDIIIINYLEYVRDNKNLIDKTIEFFEKCNYTFEEEFINSIKSYSQVFDNQTTIKNIDVNLIKNLETPIQKIYYGAPGTGKSHSVTKLIEEYYGEDNINNQNVIRTTIYQDYSYYDFIGSLIPITDEENKITYNFKPGPFTIALHRALLNPEAAVFLIVEEMSRGNIASIFGDTFQLLDRKNGVSEYAIDNEIISRYLKINGIKDDEIINMNKIYLPQNLHIIGTVNTSDQNVYVMDTAFKRRFSFEYVSVDPVKDNDCYLNDVTFNLGEAEFNWIKLYTTLNKFIVGELGLNEDKQLGQFFIKFKENEEENKNEIKDKLLQYLWYDVQNARILKHYSIFNESVNTFGKLYKDFSENTNVFSSTFMAKYNGKDPV